jgi:hypothetical protein
VRTTGASSSAATVPNRQGNDEVALVRLWREKRAEVEPEDRAKREKPVKNSISDCASSVRRAGGRMNGITEKVPSW